MTVFLLAVLTPLTTVAPAFAVDVFAKPPNPLGPVRDGAAAGADSGGVVVAPPRANRPATTGARAAQSGIERGRRPITPLWVIAAFVSLAETVTGIAVAQASGGVRVALTAFVVGFPVFVAAAFFLVLWDRPHHFYPPTEFGPGADVSVYVEAMRRRSASEARSYAQIQDAVRAAVSSPDILDRLKSAVGAPVETGDIRQVLGALLQPRFKTSSSNGSPWIHRPFLGARERCIEFRSIPDSRLRSFSTTCGFRFRGLCPPIRMGAAGR